MKTRFLFCLLLVLALPATAATNVVPRTANGGTLGTASKPWANIYGAGAGLTAIPAGQLTGTVADARLSANVPLKNGANTFSNVNAFRNEVQIVNSNVIYFEEWTGLLFNQNAYVSDNSREEFWHFDVNTDLGKRDTTVVRAGDFNTNQFGYSNAASGFIYLKPNASQTTASFSNGQSIATIDAGSVAQFRTTNNTVALNIRSNADVSMAGTLTVSGATTNRGPVQIGSGAIDGTLSIYDQLSSSRATIGYDGQNITLDKTILDLHGGGGTGIVGVDSSGVPYDLDTIAEFELSIGAVNVITEPEIDNSTKLAGILTDESGAAGVFPRFSLTSLATDETVKWNGANWVNTPFPTGVAVAAGSNGMAAVTNGLLVTMHDTGNKDYISVATLVAGVLTATNLGILDTGGDHSTYIKHGANLTANRTNTFVFADANRTYTMPASDGTLALLTDVTGAPSTVDYLVGTASGGLSAEIVVGTSPGGELGGSWASPTIDDNLTVTGWTLGTSIATTPSFADDDTSLATTEFVQLERGGTNTWGNTALTFSLGRNVLTNMAGDLTIASVTGIVNNRVNEQYIDFNPDGGTRVLTVPADWYVSGFTNATTVAITNGTWAEMCVTAIIGRRTNAVINFYQ